MKLREYIAKTDKTEENEENKAVPMIIRDITSFEAPSNKEYLSMTFMPSGDGLCTFPSALILNLFDQCCRDETRIRAVKTLEAICAACGVDMDAIELDDDNPRKSLIRQLRYKLVGKTIMVSVLFGVDDSKTVGLRFNIEIDLDETEFDVPPKKKTQKWSDWVNEVSAGLDKVLGSEQVKLSFTTTDTENQNEETEESEERK